MRPILELNQIGFSVPTSEGGPNKTILRGIDFQMPEGSIVVITGPNGSGKSTLARTIMGLAPPTSGTVHFDGEDITSLDISERAKRKICFAFQQPIRFKGLLVKDLLRIAAGNPLSTEVACGYLSEVGLCAASYVERELDSSLSGGELKRIEIATVLARKPRLAIFDEPEAGIDLWSFTGLISIFERMKRHASLLIISHQERLLNIADTIVVLEGGKISRIGGKEIILPFLPVEACGCNSCRTDSRRVFI